MRGTHEHPHSTVIMGGPHKRGHDGWNWAAIVGGLAGLSLAATALGQTVTRDQPTVPASQPVQPPPAAPTTQAPVPAPPPPAAQPPVAAAPAPLAPSDQAPIATVPPPPPELPASAPIPAAEQAAPPPPPVQAQALSPLDIFSGGRDTGLGTDLWKGSSADVARAVIPTLADHPLSPAGAGLARRILATASSAPDGAGDDADLAAARARALLALGDADTAALILDHAAGMTNSAALSETAAEAALIEDQDDKACAIGDALVVDRDSAYWLRLRAFCQARAGKPAAQLTLTLAQQQGKDAPFDRMLPVIIAGAGDPGPASLRDGLDYAMSQQLKLDLTPALADAAPAIAQRLAAASVGLAPAAPGQPVAEADVLTALRAGKDLTAYVTAARLAQPAIAALVQAKTPLTNPVQLAMASIAAGDGPDAQAIRAGLTGDAIPGADSIDLAGLDATLSVSIGKADEPSLDRLVERGGVSDAKAAARAQAAAAFVLSLGWPANGAAKTLFAGFGLGRGDATPARLLLLEASADAGVRGDTALIALSIAEAGGAGGPGPADRARLIRALSGAGLHGDAQAFVIEGLLGLASR